MRKATTAVIAALAASLLAVPAAQAQGDVVRTDKGLVRGTVTNTNRTFQKIPFAAPPVGELRWQDPQPAKPWRGVLDGTKLGPMCAQTGFLGQPSSSEEDCLYLNVTTPAKTGKPKPVMVWIHGGGFTTGSANEYDARNFSARADVVVVTINYRLGAFGNFGFPGLANSGSYGLADQQAALRWVQRNARAFGGDPRNVTIFGESAGGLSVCAQLTTPRTDGLFHKAIIQSGACQTTYPDPVSGQQFPFWTPSAEIQQIGAGVDLGCEDIACLRKLPVEKLLPLAETFSRVAFDTRALPSNPITQLRDGRFHRVPVMVGNTHDEHTVFTALTYFEKMDAATYQQTLTALFGANAGKVAARYPLNDDGDARPELAAVLTDKSWSCPSAQAMRQLDRRTKVFGYEFNDKNIPIIFPDLPPFPYGAYHGSELVPLFGFGLPLTPEQQKLAAYMIDAWGRFARTGDPGWRHSGVQSLAAGAIGPVDFVSEHKCGFWSSML